MTLLWINLSYATFGLVVDKGRVVKAPPIARWTIGKSDTRAIEFYSRKRATVCRLGPNDREWKRVR